MKPLASLALGAVLTMTSASAALAAVPEPPAGTAATPYCDDTRISTTPYPGWKPIYGSPWFCPPYTPPAPTPPPATVTGHVEKAPQIADAVIAYPTTDGHIVTVRLGRRGFVL